MNKNTLHLTMQTELTLIEQKVSSQRTVEITVQPPAARESVARPRLNLALVLDRSGSMSGEKLDYAKQAAAHLIDLLDEQDRVAVVAYDDEVNTIVPSTEITTQSRRQIQNKVQKIQSGGSTNLSGGWLTGCKEVAANHVEGQLERTLLLTDGLANAGIVDLEELAVYARDLCSKGVSTSTFGVGEDFNEHLLEAMSTAGGGMYHYIQSPQQIPEIFSREFSELAAVTSRDVEVILDIPAEVSAEVLGAWRVETEEGKVHIYLGAMQAARPQSLYINVLTPPAKEENNIVLKGRVTGRGEDNQLFEDTAEIAFQYTDKKTIKAAATDKGLLERSSQVRVAEAVNESLKLERKGKRKEASQNLKMAIMAASPYMVQEDVENFTQMGERMQHGMDESDRKSSQYNSYKTRRGQNEGQDKQ